MTEFEQEVVRQLSDLNSSLSAVTSEVAALKECVAKQNGSVARHEAAINELRIENAKRENQCPIVDVTYKDLSAQVDDVSQRVTSLEKSEVRREQASQTSRTWVDRLMPLIYVLGTSIVILLYQHGDLLLSKMKP